MIRSGFDFINIDIFIQQDLAVTACDLDKAVTVFIQPFKILSHFIGIYIFPPTKRFLLLIIFPPLMENVIFERALASARCFIETKDRRLKASKREISLARQEFLAEVQEQAERWFGKKIKGLGMN